MKNKRDSKKHDEIIHQHLLYQSRVKPKIKHDKNSLVRFMYALLDQIKMTCLIPPRVEISLNNAWTGIMGIITSHVALHYWIDQNELQLDIYSCKKFDVDATINFITSEWRGTDIHVLSIHRDVGHDFDIVNINKDK